MKRTLLSAIAISGLATGAFAQGLELNNAGNTGNISATSNGQVYNKNGTLFNGNSYDVGATVWFGTSSSSLAVYGSYYPNFNGSGQYTGVTTGQFTLGATGARVVPSGGVAGGTIWVELQLWDYDSPLATGTYTGYAAAAAALDPVGTIIFQQQLDNPGGSPPTPPTGFTGMPSVTLIAVPEPATFALAGLGIASLLAFRRRS
jgi:hypothetical protein